LSRVFQRGQPPQSTYSFKHALVQHAAYGTLLRTQRQSLHGRIAASLKERFAERTEREPELLARHLTEAGLTEEAITYWSKAGQQAVGRFANKEAEAHLTKATELLQTLPENRSRNEKEVDLRLALAVLLSRLHGYGSVEVENCALRAKQLCDEFDDHSERFAVYRLMWNSCMMRQPVPRAIGLARELMAFAREGDDNAQLAVAHRALGLSFSIAGELSEGDALLAECTRLADSVPDADFGVYGEHPGIIGRLYGGAARCLIGFPEQGTTLSDAGLKHARARRAPQLIAWALVTCGRVHNVLRNSIDAERFSPEAIAVAEEHRLPQWLAFGMAYLGKALCSNGDPQTGIRLQEEGMRRLNAAGSMLMSTQLRMHLAESLIALSELERARRQRATAMARKTASSPMRPNWSG
jgi:hypothetical protein